MKKREKSNNVLKLLIMIFAITILVARVGSVKGNGDGGGSASSPVELTSQPVTIASAPPTDVSESFTPEISSTIAQRDFEVYLGRISTFLGTAIGTPGDTIKWRVTITGPSDLTADMLDLDEVGWKDLNGNNIQTFHYPFATQTNGSLIALGSCDNPDLHDNNCDALVGFSLDDNDEFTNADKIEFNSNALDGLYTIKYELVDTMGTPETGDDIAISDEYPVEVTLDTEGPSISDVSNQPANPTCSDNPVSVFATITDISGIQDILEPFYDPVKLTYKFKNAISSEGVTIPMDSVGDDRYMAEVSLPTLIPNRDNGLMVSYEIAANDTLGNSKNTGFIFNYTYDCLPPTADANGPYAGQEGSQVTFDASGSSDSASNIVSYEWDFGDGSSSNEPNPTHVYDDNGNYTVILTVTDDAGNKDTDTTYALIENVAPTADANGPYECNEGENVTPNGFATDPGKLDTLTFEWDTNDDGEFDDVEFKCVDDGQFPIKLKVTDKDGGIGTDSTTVSVNNVAPTANANGPYFGNEGSSVEFTCTFEDPGVNDNPTCEWNFGDGSLKETGVNVQHTYADNGNYKVVLTVKDKDGAIGTDETTATIGNVVPTANANGPYNGMEGSPIEFSGTFTNPGVLDTHTATINWGDGNEDICMLDCTGEVCIATAIFGECTISEEGGSGVVLGSHAYADNGTYKINLNVEDKDGDSGSDAALAVIENKNPVISEIVITGNMEGTPVELSASFTDDGVLDTHTATINWGDGKIEDGAVEELDGSRTVTGSHNYTDNKTYIVTLTVTDNDGGIGTDETTATILDGTPTASFTEEPTSPEEGQSVQFTDTSTSPADDIKEWFWDFGDGETSTLPNPTHTYVDDDFYNVSLTVTDSDGSSNTTWEIKVVSNVAPVVTDISVTPNPSNEGQEVTLTATFTDAGKEDIHRLPTIDWGDGTITNGTVTESDGSGTVTGNHVYADNKNGGYEATVTVWDDSPDSGSDTFGVTVNNVAPTVLAAANQTVAKEDVVTITTEFTDPGILDKHTCLIDWGDRSLPTTECIITEQNSPAGTVSGSHIYENGGTFTVTITVSDESDSGSNTSIAKVGDMVINLSSGWNLFSVPKVLENNDLATLTSDLDYSIILTYKDGQWIQPATVEPLKAYWINMEQQGKLLLRFKNASCTDSVCPVPDARQLNAGWELIGYTDTKPLRSTLALKSIEGGYSQWFGFVNGAWISHIFTQFPDINMEPGLGYWIFMTQPKTLAVLSF